MKKNFKITFITPCFNRGADSSDHGMPEIRPASIRGQLHWWYRLLGGTFEEENLIFGHIGRGGAASKIIVRVKYEQCKVGDFPTLPHKSGSALASKKAFAPGSGFELLISSRLGDLPESLESKFNRALEAWLYLGALGLRCTRGGGNFTWEGQPTDIKTYQDKVASFKLKTVFLKQVFPTAEDARKVICDTLADRAFGNSAPLGKIFGGRKTSPLRFRVVQFSDKNYRIIALWDHRTEVTGNQESDLHDAVESLRKRGKRIGNYLHEVGW